MRAGTTDQNRSEVNETKSMPSGISVLFLIEVIDNILSNVPDEEWATTIINYSMVSKNTRAVLLSYDAAHSIWNHNLVLRSRRDSKFIQEYLMKHKPNFKNKKLVVEREISDGSPEFQIMGVFKNIVLRNIKLVPSVWIPILNLRCLASLRVEGCKFDYKDFLSRAKESPELDTTSMSEKFDASAFYRSKLRPKSEIVSYFFNNNDGDPFKVMAFDLGRGKIEEFLRSYFYRIELVSYVNNLAPSDPIPFRNVELSMLPKCLISDNHFCDDDNTIDFISLEYLKLESLELCKPSSLPCCLKSLHVQSIKGRKVEDRFTAIKEFRIDSLAPDTHIDTLLNEIALMFPLLKTLELPETILYYTTIIAGSEKIQTPVMFENIVVNFHRRTFSHFLDHIALDLKKYCSNITFNEINGELDHNTVERIEIDKKYQQHHIKLETDYRKIKNWYEAYGTDSRFSTRLKEIKEVFHNGMSIKTDQLNVELYDRMNEMEGVALYTISSCVKIREQIDIYSSFVCDEKNVLYVRGKDLLREIDDECSCGLIVTSFEKSTKISLLMDLLNQCVREMETKLNENGIFSQRSLKKEEWFSDDIIEIYGDNDSLSSTYEIVEIYDSNEEDDSLSLIYDYDEWDDDLD